MTDATGRTTSIELAELPTVPVHDASAACVLAARGTFDPQTTPLDADGQGVPYQTYAFGAQIAEVDVDPELGTVKVRRIVAAHDVGRAINPTQVEGQIHGGIAQGLGFALMEAYVPGRTENLHDYLIPTVGDMPEIECLLIEDAEPSGPYGAKGVGEPALIPTAPAILGAIHDAVGVRITQLPGIARPGSRGDPRARRQSSERPRRRAAGVTAFGRRGAADVRMGALLGYLVGIAGLAFSLTILWLSMRAVMGIGGACASGGPYVPAVECPDAVVALTPVSIFGLFIFGGLALWGGASIGGAWAALISARLAGPVPVARLELPRVRAAAARWRAGRDRLELAVLRRRVRADGRRAARGRHLGRPRRPRARTAPTAAGAWRSAREALDTLLDLQQALTEAQMARPNELRGPTPARARTPPIPTSRIASNAWPACTVPATSRTPSSRRRSAPPSTRADS